MKKTRMQNTTRRKFRRRNGGKTVGKGSAKKMYSFPHPTPASMNWMFIKR